MWYFKFSKVLVSVTSSLFFFCACHASAMDPRWEAGNDALKRLKEIEMLEGIVDLVASPEYYNYLDRKYGYLYPIYVSLKQDKPIPKQEDKPIPNKQEDKPIPNKQEDKPIPNKQEDKLIPNKQEDKLIPKQESIRVLLERKIDKIVIEDSAKEELKKLGVGRVEFLDSIPNVRVEFFDSIPNVVVDLVFEYGVLAPVKKYLRMPSDYLTTIRKNLEKCNSIRLLKHPKEKEGIILACDNKAIVFCSTGECETIEIK